MMILKEYTYNEFGYPVLLKNVEMVGCDGHWYPRLDRETILKNEATRLEMVFREAYRDTEATEYPSLTGPEKKVLLEARAKGYIK